jgi:hypothetical protein
MALHGARLLSFSAPAGLCAPGATAPNCPRCTPSFPALEGSSRKCQDRARIPRGSARVLILLAVSRGITGTNTPVV